MLASKTFQIICIACSATAISVATNAYSDASIVLAQALSQPGTPTIELLLEKPKQAEEPVVVIPDPPDVEQPPVPPTASLPTQYQISHPRDSQPSVPTLPNIGTFLEMPGTNGNVQFARLTDATNGWALAHSYSKRSAIDPFNKYILLNGFLYNLTDLKEFTTIPFGFEYVASQTTPDEFFGFQGNNFRKWNAVTGQMTDIWSAPGGSTYTIGQWEGQQSWDDRYVVLCWDNGGTQIAVIDIANKSLVAQIPASSVPGKFNWADVSPNGTYALVGTSTGVFRFDINLTGMVELNTNANQTGDTHGDMMFDVAGNEVYVQEGNFNHGDISYVILNTNTLQKMDLVDTATQSGVSYPNSASHISGQARDIQGRAFVSLQNTSGMSSMFAVDLIPGQTQVYNWGHSYTTGNTYPSHAKATISNDGKRVIWSSDWMTGGASYTFMSVATP